MGDREAHLDAALAALDRVPGTMIAKRSPLYVTAPWGKTDQPDYLNMVAEISTNLEPHDLLKECKAIERAEGRVPGERWGPRPLDIDILLYNSRQVSSDELQIPHPRMWERAFVLRPLADITSDLEAPDGTTVSEWLRREKIASQGIRRYANRK